MFAETSMLEFGINLSIHVALELPKQISEHAFDTLSITTSYGKGDSLHSHLTWFAIARGNQCRQPSIKLLIVHELPGWCDCRKYD